jgi:hypothetical protein
MNILVVDAQGGGIGKQVVTAVKERFEVASVIAVGTNSVATTAMRKAGADFSATGENAVVVNSRKADVIIGPVGIVIADSLWGEITPKMATAIGQSDAVRILIPVNHCNNVVAGVKDLGITELVKDVVDKLSKIKM